MTNSRYSRNRLYISESDQKKIREYKIFLGGAGIGSKIAECALRMGFENITIVDGDNVEDSNLNRQNYLTGDIAEPKTDGIKSRLLSINPEANIVVHNCYINEANVDSLISGHDVFINALDFTSDIPFVLTTSVEKIISLVI